MVSCEKRGSLRVEMGGRKPPETQPPVAANMEIKIAARVMGRTLQVVSQEFADYSTAAGGTATRAALLNQSELKQVLARDEGLSAPRPHTDGCASLSAFLSQTAAAA